MAGFEVGTDGPDRILVAIDGSDTSLRAAAYAADLARRQGASVRVVYVSTVPASAAWVGAEADLGQEIAEELGRQVSRLVKHAKWPVIVVP